MANIIPVQGKNKTHPANYTFGHVEYRVAGFRQLFFLNPSPPKCFTTISLNAGFNMASFNLRKETIAIFR